MNYSHVNKKVLTEIGYSNDKSNFNPFDYSIVDEMPVGVDANGNTIYRKIYSKEWDSIQQTGELFIVDNEFFNKLVKFEGHFESGYFYTQIPYVYMETSPHQCITVWAYNGELRCDIRNIPISIGDKITIIVYYTK